MSELLHFIIDEDTSIAVEVDEDTTGFAPVSTRHETGPGLWSGVTFTAAISRARRAAEVTLEQFKSMVNGPDEVEIELGIRLSGQSGVVLAKTATEGHIQVKLTWRKPAE